MNHQEPGTSRSGGTSHGACASAEATAERDELIAERIELIAHNAYLRKILDIVVDLDERTRRLERDRQAPAEASTAGPDERTRPREAGRKIWRRAVPVSWGTILTADLILGIAPLAPAHLHARTVAFALSMTAVVISLAAFIRVARQRR